MSNWDKPTAVSDIDMAFPSRGGELTPDYATVPDEFKQGRSVQEAFANRWFFNGDAFERFSVYGPSEGINGDDAVRHLQVVLGSCGTKHEHKIAGAAYLLSLWFDKIEEIGAENV